LSPALCLLTLYYSRKVDTGVGSWFLHAEIINQAVTFIVTSFQMIITWLETTVGGLHDATLVVVLYGVYRFYAGITF
jgi:hypothetical protein